MKEFTARSKGMETALNAIERNFRELAAAGKISKNELQANIATIHRYRESLSVTTAPVHDLNKELSEQQRELESTKSSLTGLISKQARWIAGYAIIFGTLAQFRKALTDQIALVDASAYAFRTARSDIYAMGGVQKQLQGVIEETARKYGVGFQEVAEVLMQLGSANLSTEESIAALVPTMNLIIGLGGDSAEIVRLMVSIYNKFGGELVKGGTKMDEFGRIADVLTGVYRNHIFELNEMTNAYKYVIAQADAMGVNFVELSGLLAVLNDNFIKSGMSGRNLKAITIQVLANSDKLNKSFNLGIDESKPVNLIDILGKLSAKMTELGVKNGELTPEIGAKLSEVFGREANSALLTYMANIDDVIEGIKNLDANTKDLAQTTANVMLATPGKQLTMAGMAIGEAFRFIVGPLVDGMVALAEKINSVTDAFKELNDHPLVKTIKFLAEWAVIIGGSILAIKILTSSLKFMTGVTNQSLASVILLSRAKAQQRYQADRLTLSTWKNYWATILSSKATKTSAGLHIFETATIRAKALATGILVGITRGLVGLMKQLAVLMIRHPITAILTAIAFFLPFIIDMLGESNDALNELKEKQSKFLEQEREWNDTAKAILGVSEAYVELIKQANSGAISVNTFKNEALELAKKKQDMKPKEPKK